MIQNLLFHTLATEEKGMAISYDFGYIFAKNAITGNDVFYR